MATTSSLPVAGDYAKDATWRYAYAMRVGRSKSLTIHVHAYYNLLHSLDAVQDGTANN